MSPNAYCSHSFLSQNTSFQSALCCKPQDMDARNISPKMRLGTNFQDLRYLYKRLEEHHRSSRRLQRGNEPAGSDFNGEKQKPEGPLARIREYLKHPWERPTSIRSPAPIVTTAPITLRTPEAFRATLTELCNHCLNYNFSRETLDPSYRSGRWHIDVVFTTFGKLVRSSAICPLCRTILEGLESDFAKKDNQGFSLKHRVGKRCKILVSIREESETTISFFIVPPEEKNPRYPVPRLTESNLRVYSETADWARSPPLIPWSEPCVDRLKQWLIECVHSHGPQCCRMLSGEEIDESSPPVLPSRVIDVGPLSGLEASRLVESNGRRAYYTALSYCWGSTQKSDRPYLTTTTTVEKHLSELPWDLLPKTIQDAILLTRAIGIRYLWIDSLCIIQNSNADWEKEAAKMGTVYARARLVIAATTGADAEAGLFPFQTYIHRPSAKSPSLYFRKLANERGTGHKLPLFTRGWATQEWVLARRTVFWTQERMAWCCRNKLVVDDDTGIGYVFVRLFQHHTTWREIVARYSGRHLTYPRDKFVALNGIVNEIQKKRPEDKYVLGSWLSEIHWELLWSGQAAPSTESGLEELHIPSWSWASHPGGVQFLVDDSNLKRYFGWEESYQSSISFLDDSSVQIVARSKAVDLHKPDMVNYCFRWIRQANYSVTCDSFSPLPFWHDLLGICPQDSGPGSVQIGLQGGLRVVFDTTDFLSTYRKERDGLGMSAGIPGEFSFVELANVDFARESAGLLLRKSPHTSGRYIRVGFAFTSKEWLNNAKRGEFVVE
ncbi:heterokaryon incompatibility protein-domain-containing protein [Copromyces sp. CBS 386.78]|nr:heterokaryon incompatibility protein-domain-containing protein [Copromyces sp. CBS 386.78]